MRVFPLWENEDVSRVFGVCECDKPDGGCTHGNGGLGSRSTLSSVRMSSLGSWQCCSGLSPGTLRASSNGAISGELPKMLERAEAEVARMAVVRAVKNFMLVGCRCVLSRGSRGGVEGGGGVGEGGCWQAWR